MFTNYSVAHKQFMRQMFGSGGHLKSIEDIKENQSMLLGTTRKRKRE